MLITNSPKPRRHPTNLHPPRILHRPMKILQRAMNR
jgi:hypothetical protein